MIVMKQSLLLINLNHLCQNFIKIVLAEGI